MTQTIVICPECLTAWREGISGTSPDREGKRCWRCPGKYVKVEIPEGKMKFG